MVFESSLRMLAPPLTEVNLDNLLALKTTKAGVERIRVMVAEIEKWKPNDNGGGINTWDTSYTGDKLWGLKPRIFNGKVVSYTVDCVVPAYTTSLDAIREAQERVFSQRPGYWDGYYFNLLCQVVTGIDPSDGWSDVDNRVCFNTLMATPVDYCIALILLSPTEDAWIGFQLSQQIQK